MPETLFRVRWPDGEVETCWSPSTVITQFLVPGQAYALHDFVAACRTGLRAASERVAARYGGTGCSHALAQLDAIERKAATLAAAQRDGTVCFEGFLREQAR